MKTLVSPSPLLRASRLLVAAGLAWTGLAGLAAGDLAARRTAALADEPWLLFASNRDGALRGYRMRPDGARLTPLLAGRGRLVPMTVSQNGETVAYSRAPYGEGAVYVSAASGRGLRRMAEDATPSCGSTAAAWSSPAPA